MAPESVSATMQETTLALERRAAPRRTPTVRPARAATDDEILGLLPDSPNVESVGAGLKAAPTPDSHVEAPATIADPSADSPASSAESEPLRAALDASPELRRAWDDAQAYRETFATPEEARGATALLADLDRMDALFFSRRPEDHAELARAVAALDPAAFASLAQAMSGLASIPKGTGSKPAPTADSSAQTPSTPTQSQSDFFHATNAAAVRGVLDAIETQVERLLPENISKSARNRVVGEIYRELDTTLRSNRQLAQQMREAFRSGALDADHQRAVVSLVTGRARQALPGVAKRVLNEWTSTVVAAHNDRRNRQQAAERRVDIAGSSGTGSDGPRSMTPRDVDYKRMSDSDILNL
jgi:hypothetical protein